MPSQQLDLFGGAPKPPRKVWAEPEDTKPEEKPDAKSEELPQEQQAESPVETAPEMPDTIAEGRANENPPPQADNSEPDDAAELKQEEEMKSGISVLMPEEEESMVIPVGMDKEERQEMFAEEIAKKTGEDVDDIIQEAEENAAIIETPVNQILPEEAVESDPDVNHSGSLSYEGNGEEAEALAEAKDNEASGETPKTSSSDGEIENHEKADNEEIAKGDETEEQDEQIVSAEDAEIAESDEESEEDASGEAESNAESDEISGPSAETGDDSSGTEEEKDEIDAADEKWEKVEEEKMEEVTLSEESSDAEEEQEEDEAKAAEVAVTSENEDAAEEDDASEEDNEAEPEQSTGTLGSLTDKQLFSKRYYTMAETTEMLGISHSMVRFWENEFDILKPRKNRKGDRYFRPQDIKNLELIYHLLKVRRFTIEGAREYLKTNKDGLQKLELIKKLEGLKSFLTELKAQL